jgi:hypothetical protein
MNDSESALAAALHNAVGEPPHDIEPQQLLAVARRRPQRFRLVAGIAAGAVVLAVVVGVGLIVSHGRHSAARLPASGRSDPVVPTAAPRINAVHAPTVIRFDGIGAVDLGESSAALQTAGFRSTRSADGCRQFSRDPHGLYVTLDPRIDEVVAVDPVGNPTYRTAAGIHIGSSSAQVQRAYAGHRFVMYPDGGFGQGSSGFLVAERSGWIGFTVRDGAVVGIKVGDRSHATNAESGC